MASPQLPKIRQPESLQDTAFYVIREAILTGQLLPGQQLHQVELAENLGVSRMPVREALRRLESQGLVVFRQNYGAHVKEFRRKDIEEIYFVRFLLEGAAARLAAERVNPLLIHDLQSSVAAMAESLEKLDYAKVQEYNRTFHVTIYRASGSDTLVSQIDQLWNGFPRHPLQKYERAASALREHRAILAALQQGDANLADHMMRDHLKAGLAVLLEDLST